MPPESLDARTITKMRRIACSILLWLRRAGLRATLQWLWLRFRRALGLAEPVIFQLQPRQIRYALRVRLRASSDLPVFWEIFLDEPFACLRRLEDVTTILDLGANAGYASTYFLNCFPHAHVLAVEPDERNIAICSANLAPYGDRARLLQGAVWDTCTELSLVRQDTPDCGRECATQVAAPTGGASGTVRAWDVPNLIALTGWAQIDLLKIDIEGAEQIIFNCDSRNWLSHVRHLCIELHGPVCEQAFFEALAGFDYEIRRAGHLVICTNLRIRSTSTHDLHTEERVTNSLP